MGRLQFPHVSGAGSAAMGLRALAAGTSFFTALEAIGADPL